MDRVIAGTRRQAVNLCAVMNEPAYLLRHTLPLRELLKDRLEQQADMWGGARR